ncbi:MAG: phosphatase [Bacteroidetes bacterium]|nr:phosphatase [Bacteroidota bacterium]
MKLAAIDIGSNAVRLYIARPLHPDLDETDFKSVEFTRLPLRLGDDVFKNREISRKKADLLTKAMQSFALLMEIFNVDMYRACATSAMRDATNSARLVKEIRKTTGIRIEVISGKEESRLVQSAIMDWLPARHTFLHVDVGGGSTEIALVKAGKIKHFESFNIGTVRLREKKVKPAEFDRMEQWLRDLPIPADDVVHAVGTGGNIVKLHSLAGTASSEAMNLHHLKSTNQYLESLDIHDRVYELKMNPDRAEVIHHAGHIFIRIMELCNIHDVYAPNLGLKDGIVRELWRKHHQSLRTD